MLDEGIWLPFHFLVLLGSSWAELLSSCTGGGVQPGPSVIQGKLCASSVIGLWMLLLLLTELALLCLFLRTRLLILFFHRDQTG